jgi:hypothetical protein
MSKLIIIIVAIILLSGLALWIQSGERRSIKNWATSQGWEVIKVHGHMTCIGTPFYWKHKNTMIWELDVNNHGVNEKWWVRPGVFSDEHIKDEK